MKSDDTSEIKQLLGELREEHRDLDLAINRMAMDPWQDQLHLRVLRHLQTFFDPWLKSSCVCFKNIFLML